MPTAHSKSSKSGLRRSLLQGDFLHGADQAGDPKSQVIPGRPAGELISPNVTTPPLGCIALSLDGFRQENARTLFRAPKTLSVALWRP